MLRVVVGKHHKEMVGVLPKELQIAVEENNPQSGACDDPSEWALSTARQSRRHHCSRHRQKGECRVSRKSVDIPELIEAPKDDLVLCQPREGELEQGLPLGIWKTRSCRLPNDPLASSGV